MKHLRQVIWLLSQVWQYGGFSRISKMRLARKSINLYLVLIGFTDRERPLPQLRQAMIAALLTAVYDYDSDWEEGERSGTNFKYFLSKLVAKGSAYQVALESYSQDVSEVFRSDGLERGETALLFYSLLIDSIWLKAYSTKEIRLFGRKLQIVDDAMDYEKDKRNKHTNCLLSPRAPQYVVEVREFFRSEFFLELLKRCRIYRIIQYKVGKRLESLN